MQIFNNVPVNKKIKIKEGDSTFTSFELVRLDFMKMQEHH